jgi:hypothetical protein
LNEQHVQQINTLFTHCKEEPTKSCPLRDKTSLTL